VRHLEEDVDDAAVAQQAHEEENPVDDARNVTHHRVL